MIFINDKKGAMAKNHFPYVNSKISNSITAYHSLYKKRIRQNETRYRKQFCEILNECPQKLNTKLARVKDLTTWQ